MRHSKSSDITGIDDIKLLVDMFYIQVREDELLGPVFEARIKGDWQPHLEKMYKFWQTVLCFEHTYSGKPFDSHAVMPIGREHFDRWLELFYNTVDELFIGDKAEEIKTKAGNTAKVFQYKLDYLRNKTSI